MKINVKGPIVTDSEKFFYDWFGIPATSPASVNEAISKAEDGEELEVEFASNGGDVFAGSEIYTALKSYKGNTIGRIVGLAASAASVAAMGVKILEISPTASIMIHKASMRVGGNSTDLEHAADVLKGIDQSIANAYEIKTGMKGNELLDLMDKETWLTAQQAKELGFADTIMFADEFKAVASISDDGTIPKVIMDKLKNEFKGKFENKKTEPKNENENLKNIALNLAKAQLELLTL